MTAELSADPFEGHLDIKVRFAPALVMIRAAGELTRSCAHLLLDALDTAGSRVGPGQLLVLDLSRVTHFDTVALASLGPALTRVLESGVELRIKESPAGAGRLAAEVPLTGS